MKGKVDYIPHFSPIEAVEVPTGDFKEIRLLDRSTLRLETVFASVFDLF